MLDHELLLTDIHLGTIVYPPRSTLGPRVQLSLQFVLLHTGTMTIWIDHVRCDIPLRSVTVLFPGHSEHFVFATETTTHHSWIHLFFEDYSESIMMRFQQIPRSLPLGQEMDDLMRSALVVKNSSLSTSEELTRTIAMHMFWRFLGEGERLLQHQDRGFSTVEKARIFIQEHLAEPLTLEHIAAAANVSPTHLIRLFRAQLGQTPMVYVWHRRVALGVELLRASGLAMHLIAERCGFQSSHHFSRRIKQVVGMTATQFRTQYRGDEDHTSSSEE